MPFEDTDLYGSPYRLPTFLVSPCNNCWQSACHAAAVQFTPHHNQLFVWDTIISRSHRLLTPTHVSPCCQGTYRRGGIAQYPQIHILQPGGAQVLEKLFPGFLRTVAEAGGHIGNMFTSNALYHPTVGRFKENPSAKPLPTINCSRHLLSETIRREISRNDKVHINYCTQSLGYVMNADSTAVTGVRLGDGSVVAADLVVDTTGRASNNVRWLSDVGYPAPPVMKINPDSGYVGRWVVRVICWGLLCSWQSGHPNRWQSGT